MHLTKPSMFLHLTVPLAPSIPAWFVCFERQLHQMTLSMFLHSKYNVKESQGLARIPETLVIAMDFINLPTPLEQQQVSVFSQCKVS
jgi:hypothetical protein